MVGFAFGGTAGARTYNIVHSYTLPIILGAAGHFLGPAWLLHVAMIWVAHIAIDRAIGYGLKYATSFQHTHLGVMGKARKTQPLADAS